MTPVSSFFRVTVVCGTTAPLGSLTVPSIALVNCAHSGQLTTSTSSITNERTIRRGITVPSAIAAHSKTDANFATQRADHMNLLFAVKGDFLKQAFEKPKRYSSFSRDYVWEHIC